MDEEELFDKLTKQKVLDPGPRVGEDVIYTPPRGLIRRDRRLNQPLQEYMVREPTAQTDLLQNPERLYILPYIVSLSTIFRVPPVTDDIYRFFSEEVKASGLFLILSRSYVKKLQSGWIVWDAVLVVIKKMIVGRVRCLYHPDARKFQLKEVHLWQNNTGDYYRIADERLTWELIPGIMERYVEYEGLFKETSGNE